VADNIYQDAYIGSEAAWHGKGVTMDGLFYARDIIEKAGFDYEVVKIPLFTEDGQKIPKFATVRNDLPIGHEDRVLGVVGERYVPVQNQQAFSFFDNVVGEGKAIYTSAGILGHGERTFVVAKIPREYYIAEDEYEQFVVLNNSHDGSYALRILVTSVRVVCQNTLTMALRKFKSKVSLRHTTNVGNRMLDSANLLGLVDQRFNETQAMFNQLVETPLTHPLFSQYVTELFPSDNPNKKTRDHREGVAMMLEHDDQRNHKDTFYGAFNALTQYTDYQMVSKCGKFENAIFGRGNKLKQKALTLALEYSK